MTKTIFFDVDTQNDFMNSNGALYVPDAERIKWDLELLTRHACFYRIPVFGSADRHFGTPEYKEREGELAKYGGPFPEHCMDGTPGQLKIGSTQFIGTKDDESEVIPGFITNPLKNQKPTLRYYSPQGKILEVEFEDSNLEKILE